MGLYYTCDAHLSSPRFRRSARLPALQRLARAQSRVSCARRRSLADRRPGAGTARARNRHPMERSVGRCAARVARDGPRDVLRREAHRHRAGRPLLSGHGRWRRSAARAALRAAVAAEVPRRAATHRAHAPRRLVRTEALSRRAPQELAHRDGARLPRLPARILSAAASELAESRLATQASVVRARGAARSARAGDRYNRPLLMKLLGSLASPYTRKVRVVAAEKKIECELELVDVNPVENPVNARNPLGQVPTLVLDDGTALYDSRVIVDFLDARPPISRLIPEETRDRVTVRRWEALADGVLDAGLLVRYELQRPKHERSKGWSDKQLARMHRGTALMPHELAERAWCHAV